MFIRFDMIHERNGRMDRRTPHADIYRAYAYASHGKNDDLQQSAISKVEKRL